MGRNNYTHYFRGVFQKNKNLFPNIPYHIIQRAPGKEQLFIEDADYLKFLQLFKKMTIEFAFKVEAFCLMPNHIHILGNATSENFSEAMQYLFKNYAIYFNKKYYRKGHVFHGPFRVVPVNYDLYHIIVSTYIHLNPVKASLVQDEEDWRWSSIKLYYYPHKKAFVDPSHVLKLISKDINIAAKNYKKMIQQLKIDKNISISESKGAIDNYLKTSFKKFINWFRTSYAKEEYEVINLLAQKTQKENITKKERKSAYIYAIEQLLSRGYDSEMIRRLLNLPKSTFYRYWKEITPTANT